MSWTSGWMRAMKPKLRLNKERFFEDLGYEPHEGQWAVHRSAAPRRVLACGVRWGKSTCAMMEGVAAAMAPQERSCGWIVAPNYDLAHRIYHQIVELFQEELPHRVIECSPRDHRLVVRNLAGGKSEIRARTADNPVSLLGEGLDWLIVDEFARLKPEIWEGYLSQRLADKRGWALLISTPDGRDFFHELHQRGAGDDPGWKSWNFPTWTSPHIDKAFLEAEKQRLPEALRHPSLLPDPGSGRESMTGLSGVGEVRESSCPLSVLIPRIPTDPAASELRAAWPCGIRPRGVHDLSSRAAPATGRF